MDLINAILMGTSIYALWKKTQPVEPGPGQMLITPGELAVGVPATPEIHTIPPLVTPDPMIIPSSGGLPYDEILLAPQVCPPLCGPGDLEPITIQEELIRQIDPAIIVPLPAVPQPNALIAAGLPADAIYHTVLFSTPTVVQEQWISPVFGSFIVTITLIGETKTVTVAADMPMGLTDPVVMSPMPTLAPSPIIVAESATDFGWGIG